MRFNYPIFLTRVHCCNFYVSNPVIADWEIMALFPKYKRDRQQLQGSCVSICAGTGAEELYHDKKVTTRL
jgi:hypothetical protein